VKHVPGIDQIQEEFILGHGRRRLVFNEEEHVQLHNDGKD
jgi:hypothetical protein